VLLSAGFLHMLPDQLRDAQKLGVDNVSVMIFGMVGVLIPFLLEKSALLHCVTGGTDLHDIFDVHPFKHGDKKEKQSKAGSEKLGPNYGSTDDNSAELGIVVKAEMDKSGTRQEDEREDLEQKDRKNDITTLELSGAPLLVSAPVGEGAEQNAGLNSQDSAELIISANDAKTMIEEADTTYIRIRANPNGNTECEKYRIPIQRGCCNRGEGVHFALKARCINCKTVINAENEPEHLDKDCPTIMFPSQSLIGIALQPVRGQKQDIVEDLFIRHSKGSNTTISHLLVIILSVHAMCAGISFGANQKFGTAVGLAIAIVSHKAFAGFALGMSFRQNGVDLKTALSMILLFASMTPLGCGFGYLASHETTPRGALWFSMIFKGVAAGTFIYISMVEILLEEFEGKDDKCLKLGGFLLGNIGMGTLGYFI